LLPDIALKDESNIALINFLFWSYDQIVKRCI
jgi:hypothetical protein